MNQKEGVFKVIGAYLKEHKLKHTNEKPLELSTEARKAIGIAVANGLHSGDIAMKPEAKAKYSSVELLMKHYVPGLISNWLRKDKRLNGNVDHEIQNPGSRSGSGDKVVKNLKALLKNPALNDKQRAAVQTRIDKRTAELKAEKVPTIDWEILKDLDLDAIRKDLEA